MSDSSPHTTEVGSPSAEPWEAVVNGLDTNVESGLANATADQRLSRHGPNVLSAESRSRTLERVFDQFNDVLIWLLLAAAAVSGFLLEAWIDAAAIAAIVLLNAAIGFTQETRANNALEKLKDMQAPEAVVLRNGSKQRIAAELIVPGDILHLESGDLIAADARIVKSVHLVVNEAPLTGESMPIPKSEDAVPPGTPLADRTSMLHAGTAVVSGRGVAIVVETGSATEMGTIANLFSDDRPQTPLQVELSRVGRRLAALAGVAAVLVFAAGLLRSYPVETMLLTAVALAVAAIPEGLPAVVTVSLSAGLQRMARRNAVVRRLPAVEALGAVDVVCTDKTGTITAPEIEVAEVRFLGSSGSNRLDSLDKTDSRVGSALLVALLCNDSFESPDGWVGDPTEIALKRMVDEHSGLDSAKAMAKLPRVDEVGFDSRRKMMTTVHTDGAATFIASKGAPEVLADICTEALGPNGPIPLSDEERNEVMQSAESLASAGMRTLALACRRGRETDEEPEEALTYVALVGLREKLRPEVPDAVESARKAGVRTVMITGDHAVTARAVSNAVGISEGSVMEGTRLSETSADELSEFITDYTVFARVDPADKVKIIDAWHARGARVAMTGDGVNDAPALHRADIGVAMGSGTDVAKEAAGLVLTDDNYATVVGAIEEGRRLFANLRNVVHYLISANASEVLFVLTGILAFGSLGLPITAVQLLWINLISDAMPAIALGMDRPARDLMADPPGQGRDILSKRNLMLLGVQGSILAAASVAALVVGTYVLDGSSALVQTMVFTTLVLSQLLHALNVRHGRLGTDTRSVRPRPLLLYSILGSMLIHVGVVYTPFGNEVFGTVPLGAAAAFWSLMTAVASFAAIRLFNRRVAT